LPVSRHFGLFSLFCVLTNFTNFRPISELTDEKKIEALKASTWLQSGTNKFASQKGQTGFGKLIFVELIVIDPRYFRCSS
jgi:hypothetical protein